jgi:Peptidase family M28
MRLRARVQVVLPSLARDRKIGGAFHTGRPCRRGAPWGTLGDLRHNFGTYVMRSFWTGLLIGLIAVPPALVILSGWYMLAVPGRSYGGPLAASTPKERELASRLRAHVMSIATAPHNVQHDEALEAVAQYIERELQNSGYSVGRQEFSVDGSNVRNIEATQEPRENTATATLVVGAHYDSFEDSPGANDNATGAAAVLELARLLKDWKPQRTRLRLVFFVNEEPPYYRTVDMGSWRYAERLSEQGEHVLGMIALETIGAFSDAPNSQRYPPPFGLIFPSTANFVAFVGLPSARRFLHEVIGSFRRNMAFPSVGGVAPDVIPGIGWSDHWAFHQFGGVMITDTAPYRYAHYHLPSDTPEKVDYDKLARITNGLWLVVRDLAQ